MNENNYLEEVDIEFMFQSCINAISKTFSYTDEDAKESAFEAM